MILNPPVLALLSVSLITTLMVLYTAIFGVLLLRKWDLSSGSEEQLLLERKTHLISTLISYALGFQLLSLFFFIMTAENMHILFTGAMCAAGTFQVNAYGYPSLVLKGIVFVLSGMWLVLNHADTRGFDYPLIRTKYRFLIALVPVVIVDAGLQWAYFLNLRPDVITSCCGSLFSPDSEGVTSDLASLPAQPMMKVFYSGMVLTLLLGIYVRMREKMTRAFAILSGAMLPVSLASLISFVTLYYYEMPSHHCPFDILQKEYGYIGYPLYVMLLFGSVAGMSSGVLAPYRDASSLSPHMPRILRRLVLVSVVMYAVFSVLVTCRIVVSDLRLN